ncbi:hypothetical protein AAI421_17990 [Rhodococcus aetherivorans]|uniref:hypothetical protein n=1 Tax=Rhodococcus aetherivorans TaxID=191292 RepID=UPI0031D87BDD
MTVECEICGRASADAVPYCSQCADTLRAELMAVPGLVVDLDITSDRLDRLAKHQEGGKSTEAPLPIRLGRDGFVVNYRRPLALLTNAITSWANVAGWDLDETDPPTGLRQLVLNNRGGRSHRYDPTELLTHPIRPVETVAVWLAHQPEAIRAVQSPHRMHDDVIHVVAHVRKLVDRLPERVLKGPCPYVGYDEHGDRAVCGARLYAERGEEWIRCPKCGSLHEVRALEAAALHGVEDRLFELRELLVLMEELGEPVPKSTLYAWANDPRWKRIEPKAWRRANGQVVDVWIDRRDTPLYRLGDVREQRRRRDREKAAEGS